MAIVNITVENDADWTRSFQYAMTDATPINIAGGSMEMMLRKHAEDTTVALRVATDTGEIVFNDPLLGIFSITILQDVLVRLTVGEYEHSLILTKDGRKKRIWSGTFTNNAGATR